MRHLRVRVAALDKDELGLTAGDDLLQDRTARYQIALLIEHNYRSRFRRCNVLFKLRHFGKQFPRFGRWVVNLTARHLSCGIGRIVPQLNRAASTHRVLNFGDGVGCANQIINGRLRRIRMHPR